MRLLIRKVDQPAAPKQKIENMSKNKVADKSTSVSRKLQNTSPNNTNISPTLDTSMSLPTLDYNIVDDMKKTWVNISLFKLAII